MVTVPNVIGLNPSIAKQRLESLNLNVVIKGVSGGDESLLSITTQSLSPESSVPIGSVIEITSVQKDTD